MWLRLRGKTWQAQRHGGQRTAVLFVQARSAAVPVDTVARLGNEEGYLTTALRVQTSDDSGWFAFVDVAPGTYFVAAGGSVIGQSSVVAGQIAGIATPVVTAPCTSSVGPGIPAPVDLKGGVGGYHASWYGQSGYPTLCPGERAAAVVAYYNSGSNGWLKGKMGEVAFLGTWGPQPGQDKRNFASGFFA